MPARKKMPYRRRPRRRRKKKRSTALYKNPFPLSQKKVRLKYVTTTERVPASAEDSLYLVLNGMYDMDVNDKVGNIQPVFYDQLLGASGPYRKYQVTGWKTKITLVNAALRAGVLAENINVCYTQVNSTEIAQMDTWAEVSKLPGTTRGTLTVDRPLNIKRSGKLRRFVPTIGAPDPITTSGAYGSNPSQQVYGVLWCSGADEGALLNYSIKIEHTFDVILYDRYVVSS